MSDDGLTIPDTAKASAGALIRQSREAAGVHLVSLAAALKVPVRKLEALEANRWHELPDATFARALAASVARHLKMDVPAVLALLPDGGAAALVAPAGLGRVDHGSMAAAVSSGLSASTGWWVGGILVAAGLLYAVPDVVPLFTAQDVTPAEVSAPANAASVAPSETSQVASPAPLAASTTVVDPVAPASTAQPVADALVPASPVAVGAEPPTDLLMVQAVSDTWLEVTDQAGQVRIQRVLKQSERVLFSEGAPFRVVLGNASGATVKVRGTAFDVAAVAKNNVARFEVK